METLKSVQSIVEKYGLDISDFEINESDLSEYRTNPYIIRGEIKIKYKPSGVEKTYVTGTNISAELIFPDDFHSDILSNFYKTRK